MDMIFGVFPETNVRLLKSIISQFFSRYSKRYNNLNVKSCLKLNGPFNKQMGRVWATKLYVPNTTLQVLFKLALMNFLIFVVFKILLNLVFMQNILNVDNC